MSGIPQSHIDALTPPGRALWDDVSGSHQLDASQQVLLLEAARAKDRLDAIDASMVGLTFAEWPRSALSAANVTSNNLAKLLASMHLGEVKGRDAAARGPYPGAKKQQTALERARARAA